MIIKWELLLLRKISSFFFLIVMQDGFRNLLFQKQSLLFPPILCLISTPNSMLQSTVVGAAYPCWVQVDCYIIRTNLCGAYSGLQ